MAVELACHRLRDELAVIFRERSVADIPSMQHDYYLSSRGLWGKMVSCADIGPQDNQSLFAASEGFAV